MTNTTQLQSLEESIKRATEVAEFGAAVERLLSNRDFKKVILDGYFKDEAVRLVHLMGDVNMQTTAAKESIVKQMEAVSGFSNFLSTQGHLARLAKRSIAADEETREELLAEDIE